MRGSEVRFYADNDDYAELFSAINATRSFQFTAMLSELNAAPVTLSDANALLTYLRSRHPESPNVFLVLPRGQEPISQVIEMHDGSGVKIKSDQVTNPDAVLVRLGGVLDVGIIVATSINTTAETLVAAQNFKILKNLVATKSVYMQEFYVMRGAEKKLHAGWRLTPDPGFSRELDLTQGTA